jgi:hypothetical protein
MTFALASQTGQQSRFGPDGRAPAPGARSRGFADSLDHIATPVFARTVGLAAAARLQVALGNQTVLRVLRTKSDQVGVARRQCSCDRAVLSDSPCPQCAEEGKQSTTQRAQNVPGDGAVPESVYGEVRSPGKPMDETTRRFMEGRFGYDFSRIEIHTGNRAERSAAAVGALAYTVGNHIVFGAAQYRPQTDAGQLLLAHELAHTIQQGMVDASASLVVGDSNSPLEREAESIASEAIATEPREISAIQRQREPRSELTVVARATPEQAAAQSATSQAAAAAPANQGASLTTEDPVLRARRLAAIAAARNAIAHLSTGLGSGYIWPFEALSGDTIDMVAITGESVPEVVAHRTSRLRQLLADLIAMVSELEAAPIPSTWMTEVATFPGKGTIQVGGSSQAWQDVLNFYDIRAAQHGRDYDDVWRNTFYIEIAPIPTRQVAITPIRSGVELGLYIVVDDPDNAPLVYHRLTPYEGWNSRGVIMSVWLDDFGYYYPYRGQKHYLPGRP